jgi:hypothetical protein
VASPTKTSETRRRNKSRKLGRERKKKIAKAGTTRTEAELFGNTLGNASR